MLEGNKLLVRVVESGSMSVFGKVVDTNNKHVDYLVGYNQHLNLIISNSEFDEASTQCKVLDRGLSLSFKYTDLINKHCDTLHVTKSLPIIRDLNKKTFYERVNNQT